MSDDLDDLIAQHQAAAKTPPTDDLDALIASHQATARQPAPPEKPSLADAVGHGLGQGFTLGFGDEINGGIQGLADWAGDEKKGWRNALTDIPAAYRRERDDFRRGDADARAAHPVAYTASEVAGSIPSTFIPGLNAGNGAKLGQILLKTAGAGALSGLGNSEASNWGGVARDTALGAGFGLGAGALGAGLGRLGAKAAAKVAGIDEAVARKAAADAAAETASARSKAGSAAQDTYKQLEHLRELNAKGLLSAEGQKLASDLESELAQKAADKLESSAARKAATSAEYSEALSTEGQRAATKAADKLSSGELKQQMGARALRYGLPAVLGAAGSALLGHSATEGALFGGALGHTFRPMMHSLKRLAQQPVVQRPVADFAARALGGYLAPAAQRAAPEVASELAPRLGRYLPAFASGQSPEEEKQIAIIQALRKQGAPQESQ